MTAPNPAADEQQPTPEQLLVDRLSTVRAHLRASTTRAQEYLRDYHTSDRPGDAVAALATVAIGVGDAVSCVLDGVLAGDFGDLS